MDLTDEERNVLQKKYQSKPIKQLTDIEVGQWSKALLLKIHVITGWSIPHSEMLNILVDQFEKKLIEQYGELNPDEIEYAFRSRGTVVEDWGKAMNLNLLDKVLLPYLNDRYRVSETERQLNYFKRRTEFDLEKDIDWRRMIEEDYQRFLYGNFVIREFPPHYYQTLEDDGIYFPKDWYKVRLRMYHRRWPAIAMEKLFYAARERCVLNLFRIARKNGAKNLYIQQ